MYNYVKKVVNTTFLFYSKYGECDIMIYPSIDKLLLRVDSKYRLVNVAATRSREMQESNHYQMKEHEYVSVKNIGRALEEVAENLIHIK